MIAHTVELSVHTCPIHYIPRQIKHDKQANTDLVANTSGKIPLVPMANASPPIWFE